MAVTALVPQDVSSDGAVVSLAALDAGGNSFPNFGNEAFIVANGGGSPITVTIASPQECSQGSTHPKVITVAAGTEQTIGLFNMNRYNDSDGNVQITYSDVTTVTGGVMRFSR